MAEDRKRKRVSTVPGRAAIFILTTAAMYIAGYFRGMDATSLIGNTVLTGLGSGIVVFLMAFSKENGRYDYNNQEHEGRFFLLYLLGLLLSVSLSFLPPAGWPYLVIFICLSLFSNSLIGITAGSLLLFMTIVLSGGSTTTFTFYFLCGMAGAALFGKLDDSYRIGVPFLSSILLLIVGETAGVVLYTNEKLGIELFIVSFMNVVVSSILLILTLKLFSALVIHRDRNRYMEINDPEYPLLAEFKKQARAEYYQAVHTAYFCDRIAKRLHLNADIAKAGGYYHRIGKLQGENSWENVRKTCEEYQFPRGTVEVLKEYLDRNTEIVEKETAVLLFSDAVISAILFLFSKETDSKLDYGPIIDTVFRKRLESGTLKRCKLTMHELEEMKSIFKEEKLYYDFLR